MKKFDYYTCLAHQTFRACLQKVWLLALLLFVIPLSTNAVNAGKYGEANFKSHSAILWEATGLAKTTVKAVAGGDFSLDFVASEPYSYNHASGGGAYDDRTIGTDVVESLEGGDFACGDIVTFLTHITVDDAAVGTQTITLDYKFTADATGQSGVALGEITYVAINYGDVGGDGTGGTDTGINDDGGSVATLENQYITGDGTLFNSNDLMGKVKITDLEAGETVVLRVDVRIACDPESTPTGNLQANIIAGLVIDPAEDDIKVGNQTIPFKNVDKIEFPTCTLSAVDPVCAGTTTTHTATTDVEAATYTWVISEASAGTAFVGGGTTKVTTAAAGQVSSSVDVMAGAAGSYILTVTISKTGYGDESCFTTVIINEIPAAPTAASPYYCVGATAVALTATGEAGATFRWYDAEGEPLTAPVTPSTAAAGSTTYYVSQVVGICESERTALVVTVVANPAVYTLSATNYCAGDPDMGTITLADSDLGVSYSLYTGADVLVDTEAGTGSAITWMDVAAGTGYYVVATGAAPTNCTSTTGTINVIANPVPVATASADGSITCEIESVQLTGAADIAVATYSWTGPGGYTSEMQNPIVTAGGTYILTVTTAAGCSDTDEVEVEVDTTVPVVTVPELNPVCVDADPVNLTGALPAGGVWTGPGVSMLEAGGYVFDPEVAGIGSHNLTYTYTAANGCEGSASTSIFVIGLPNEYELTGGSYCEGDTPAGAVVAMDGSDFGVWYQLQRRNGETWVNVGTRVDGTDEALSFGVQAAGTYRVIATTDEGGCDVTFGNATVTENPRPRAAAEVSGMLTCTNSSVTLTGNSNVENATYTWIAPGASAELAGRVIQVSQAGVYTLIVTNPATGCSNTATVEVEVNEDLPTVSIGTNGEIPQLSCNKPTATLNAAARVNGELNPEFVTFSWTGPGGFTSSAQSIEVSVGGIYVLTATNTQNGCSATASVEVYPPVYPDANAGPDKVLTCTQSTVMLEGSSDHFDGWASYTWVASNGGNIVSGGHTLTPIVDKAGTYTLTVSDSRGGCDTSDSVVVTEDKEVPDIGVTSDGKPLLSCTNSGVRIIGYSRTEGVTYVWTGPNGFTTTESSFTATVGGIYTLTVTNPANGCSASESITVTDGTALPIANAGPDKLLTCTVTSVTLEAALNAENIPVTYLWTDATGKTISLNRTATVDKPGTYTLRVTNIYTGCTATDEVVVRLNADVPVLHAEGGTLSCEDGTLRLIARSTTEGVTYHWTGPDGFMSDRQSPVVSVAGNYTVTVTNPANGCSASATVVVHPQPTTTEPRVTCHEINFDDTEIGFVSMLQTDAGPVNVFNRKRNIDGTWAPENHASIFDTGNPTGDDLDLWTPDWGHVLIINQDLNPEPNDNPWGGEMILDFSAIGPVTMTSLRALDIDIYEGASWIMLYDGEGKELYRVQLQNLGNMSQQDVDLGNTEGVMTMKVVLDGRNEHGMLAGSGAIDNIKFCITEMVESPCVMLAATIQAKAWPMPFSDRTTIEFTASETQDYVVHLYDSRGRMIRELKAGNAKAGEAVTIEVDATTLPNGMYIANIIGKNGVKKSVKLINKK